MNRIIVWKLRSCCFSYRRYPTLARLPHTDALTKGLTRDYQLAALTDRYNAFEGFCSSPNFRRNYAEIRNSGLQVSDFLVFVGPEEERRRRYPSWYASGMSLNGEEEPATMASRCRGIEPFATTTNLWFEFFITTFGMTMIIEHTGERKTRDNFCCVGWHASGDEFANADDVAGAEYRVSDLTGSSG